MATPAATPVTILRYMHIKPSASHSDPAFTDLWHQVFAWLKTNSVEAQLWQNLSIPHSIVLITGWPAHDFRSKSFDSSEEKAFGEKLGKYVDSKDYQEIQIDIHSLPLQAPILSIETFNVTRKDSEVFQHKALDAQAHVTETTKAVSAVGGWDVFHEPQQQGASTGAGTTGSGPTGAGMTGAGTTGTGTTGGGGTTGAGTTGGEKSHLTGDVLGSLGEAGHGAVPVTGGEPVSVTGGGTQSASDVTGAGVGGHHHHHGTNNNRTWISITGWQDEEQHVESAKEITGAQLESPREKIEATKNIYETMHLKKLLG